MRRKKKITTNNKNYSIQKSPFFNIQSENRLLNMLKVNKAQIKDILINKITYYNIFFHGKREVQSSEKDLYDIHNHIASLLCRIRQPDYLYSGVKDKSYIKNARFHIESKVAFTTDITAFYPSTTQEKIFYFFRNHMKCSHKIANLLAELCTINGSLPTGSQISMPLAYWANANMFDELQEFAEENYLMMTVYVDDITFSGEKMPKGFRYNIEKIITKYGHKIKKEKTTYYSAQSTKEITGLILKDKKLLPPNRQLKKLHSHLELWKKLIKEPRNGKKIEWLYKKLIGILNNIAHFKTGYKNVVTAVQAEFLSYKNNPKNYQKLNSTQSH